MKTNKVQIEYYREQLEKAIEKFFLQNQIDNTAQLRNDLSFFATNEESSRELDIDQTRGLLNDSVSLLSDLTILYTKYNEFRNTVKSKN